MREVGRLWERWERGERGVRHRCGGRCALDRVLVPPAVTSGGARVVARLELAVAQQQRRAVGRHVAQVERVVLGRERLVGRVRPSHLRKAQRRAIMLGHCDTTLSGAIARPASKRWPVMCHMSSD